MSKAALNRLKKIEAALKPAPTKGSTGAGIIPIWRQSDVDPNLYRPENGGMWVDASDMWASLPPTIRKFHPRVVIVRGRWTELEHDNP